jgi:hypothetical protein
MFRSMLVPLIACLTTWGPTSPATASEPIQLAPFLQENGLEEYHAVCVKFFSALAEAAPETAAKIFAESAGVPQDKLPDVMKRLVLNAAARFNVGVIDVELAGFSRISNRLIALYFVAHTQREPQLFLLMVYRRKSTWNTCMWTYEVDAAKILESMKGATRFSGDTILPIKKPDRAA